MPRNAQRASFYKALTGADSQLGAPAPRQSIAAAALSALAVALARLAPCTSKGSGLERQGLLTQTPAQRLRPNRCPPASLGPTCVHGVLEALREGGSVGTSRSEVRTSMPQKSRGLHSATNPYKSQRCATACRPHPPACTARCLSPCRSGRRAFLPAARTCSTCCSWRAQRTTGTASRSTADGNSREAPTSGHGAQPARGATASRQPCGGGGRLQVRAGARLARRQRPVESGPNELAQVLQRVPAALHTAQRVLPHCRTDRKVGDKLSCLDVVCLVPPLAGGDRLRGEQAQPTGLMEAAETESSSPVSHCAATGNRRGSGESGVPASPAAALCAAPHAHSPFVADANSKMPTRHNESSACRICGAIYGGPRLSESFGFAQRFRHLSCLWTTMACAIGHLSGQTFLHLLPPPLAPLCASLQPVPLHYC